MSFGRDGRSGCGFQFPAAGAPRREVCVYHFAQYLPPDGLVGQVRRRQPPAVLVHRQCGPDEAVGDGVNSGNIDKIMGSLSTASPEVQRIFAKDQAGAEMARKLGINPDWARAIIKSVGNYGEVFERNLGKGSPLGMNRAASPNRLVRDGGLLYAHPIR